MADDPRFDEYIDLLRARVLDYAGDAGDGDDLGLAFREEAFTGVVVETLEDLGQIPGAEICYFERRIGRHAVKVNGWYIDENMGRLDLLTTLNNNLMIPRTIPRAELVQAVDRAAQVFVKAAQGYYREMEPSSPAFHMMHRLHEVKDIVERVRVIAIVDGRASDPGMTGIMKWDKEGEREFQVDVWDLERLFRIDMAGLSYEPIEIDLVKRLGRPLRCIPCPDCGANHETYLAVLPGVLLHSLYHEYGARLLELNVRAFLEARGKVNRGIRDTLRDEPERFMAYNNGVSTTAEDADLVHADGEVIAIRKLVGLQVVNGGQTVASIHRAKERDGLDLSSVFVQAKITIVKPEQIEEIVPLISRYANTQNAVNEADFSSNHPFHIKIQQLSEKLWAPGEQSRWFYERARGQYQVERARQGKTKGLIARFDLTVPKAQKFDKVLLAKYLLAWELSPHVVSRGNQKNFVFFMEQLRKARKKDWLPDENYYKDLVAKALIFKRAEKAARIHKFPAYRANAIAYTVSMLAYKTSGRVNLAGIWKQQALSDELERTIHDWMPIIYDEIVESAGVRNVTEWAKKEECWRHIQTLPLSPSSALESELEKGGPVPTVGGSAGKQGLELTTEDRENLARVMSVQAEEWLRIVAWGTDSGELRKWQAGIAGTLATYAATKWRDVPSKKQAAHGASILAIAERSYVLYNGKDSDQH